MRVGARSRRGWDSCRSRPHEAVGGCAPTPRKASAASMRMAEANRIVASTITSGPMFGRTWRVSTYHLPLSVGQGGLDVVKG